MIWIELRKNNRNYKQGWNFKESVWAPTKKADGTSWPFWYLIDEVKEGDIIVHLQHHNNKIEFVGYSTAASDSYTTSSVPTQDEHEWDFIESYFKVDVKDFTSFTPGISLLDFFNSNDLVLREYFKKNKARPANLKKRLFYVIQSKRLQCLNGAYFSQFDEVLVDLLISDVGREVVLNNDKVSTGEKISNIKTRIGHAKFAENVKDNYNHKCCYPDCNVEGRGFLISGHITRWADNELLRGDTQNGICLCLIHDKAFEKGYFTLDSSLKVRMIDKNLDPRSWLKNYLESGEGKGIRKPKVSPSVVALQGHWLRIGYSENGN